MSATGSCCGSSTTMMLPVARRTAAEVASPGLNRPTVRMSSSAGPSTTAPRSATTSTCVPEGLWSASAVSTGPGSDPALLMTTTVAGLLAGWSRREGTESTEP
jgi:hypothetical protein